MIIQCKYKYGKDLPPDCLRPQSGFGFDHKFHLIIEKYYIVYAMTVYGGYIWYHICDEAYRYYPRWNPSPLFEVTDGHLSKYWIYDQRREDTWVHTIVAYPEWVNDPYYYDSLTDGDEKEVEIFKNYKSLMDLEFPNPSILDSAQILDETWLLCPLCIDAWESTSRDGMVICPMRQHMLHNPRYQKPPASFLMN